MLASLDTCDDWASFLSWTRLAKHKTINENWSSSPWSGDCMIESQICPQKDVSPGGERIIKFYLWNFLNKTQFLWKLDCWLELRRSRIVECSMWRNSTESNRHSKKRSLYFIISPLAGTDWVSFRSSWGGVCSSRVWLLQSRTGNCED